MARIAMPDWDGRVSPVFDVARRVLLVDLFTLRRQVLRLNSGDADVRARALAERGVDVLICGAVSREMAEALASSGVAVLSGVRGDVESVLRAYQHGTLRRDVQLHQPGAWPSDARAESVGDQVPAGAPARRDHRQ